MIGAIDAVTVLVAFFYEKPRLFCNKSLSNESRAAVSALERFRNVPTFGSSFIVT